MAESLLQIKTQGKKILNWKAITLLYHDVIDGDNPDVSGFKGTGPAEYKLSTIDFDSHLRAIESALKGSVITANDLAVQKYASTPVLFTFDDGGVSAYEHIAPMLESHGWRGCFFITTDRVDTPSFLSKDQINNLHQRGHVIGSHSCSHPSNMSQLSYDEILDEWKRSLQNLTDIIGEPVTIASIPSGFYSRKIAEAASQCGIKLLFTSEPVQKIKQISDCMVVGRFSVKRGMAAHIPAQFVAGNIIRFLRHYGYWNIKKVAKLLSGPIYPWLRSAYLKKKGTK